MEKLEKQSTLRTVVSTTNRLHLRTEKNLNTYKQ